MSDLEKVRQFLKEHEKSYLELLYRVKSACRDVGAELGSQVVLRVYDRTDKQGGEPLKDATKVLDASARPVRKVELKKINDIIGVTMVVQYPDQISLALDRLKVKLKNDAEQIARKDLKETYFATHATYKSKAVTHSGILCEVQCKTVLHDAWSAKMHDLTYKPLGSMDPRMKGLIEAISLSLEGLERQSQIARDMILSRQAGERKPFQAALIAFLEGVEGELLKRFTGKGAPPDPLAELRNAVKDIAKNGDKSDELVAEIGSKIQALIESEREAGPAWLIAVRFAGALPGPEAFRFLGNAADALFDSLQSLRDKELITEPEMRAIPIGFYALQDFDRALEHVDKLLAQAGALKLSEECMRILKFNKATWLLERESMRPSKPALAKVIRDEVEALVAQVRPALAMNDDAVIKDTDGLMLIVYGQTKEEVRIGIEMCMAAGEPVEGDELETAVALAYAEWRNQTGWRRFLELAEIETENAGFNEGSDDASKSSI